MDVNGQVHDPAASPPEKEPPSRSERSGEEKKFLPLPEIESRSSSQ
jgi:hypothetical protein